MGSANRKSSTADKDVLRAEGTVLNTYIDLRQMLVYGLIPRSEPLELGREVHRQAGPSGRKTNPNPRQRGHQWQVTSCVSFNPLTEKTQHILLTFPSSALCQDSKVARGRGEHLISCSGLHMHMLVGFILLWFKFSFTCICVQSRLGVCKWRLEDNLFELVLSPQI